MPALVFNMRAKKAYILCDDGQIVNYDTLVLLVLTRARFKRQIGSSMGKIVFFCGPKKVRLPQLDFVETSNGNQNFTSKQGCQIFLDKIYQNGDNVSVGA
jgi:hypothetical protein